MSYATPIGTVSITGGVRKYANISQAISQSPAPSPTRTVTTQTSRTYYTPEETQRILQKQEELRALSLKGLGVLQTHFAIQEQKIAQTKQNISKYTGGTGVIRPAEPRTLKILGINTGIKQKYSSQQLSQEAQQYRDVNYGRSARASTLAFASGVFEGATLPLREPKQFALGVKEMALHPIQSTKGLVQQVRETPESAFGNLAGQSLFFKGVSEVTPQVVKNQVPRFTYETAKIATQKADITARTLGVQQGTRGTPVLSLIKDTSETRSSLALGSPRTRTSVSELSKPIPTSVSVGSAKTVEKIVGLTPEEVTRVRSASKVSEALQADRGAVVKEPVFNVRDIPEKQRGVFSKTVDVVTGQEKGVFFGSGTTQQLPKGYQNVAIGDVDVFFPKRTSEEITNQIVPKYVGELQKRGINVRQSPTKGSVIETPFGAKVLEAKSGVNPEVLNEEIALAGFSGVRFADLSKGQSPDIIKFGSAKAITAGEQTARKGAASSFINPPLKAEELPVEFQSGGVFGKVRANEPRTLKDVAGFIQGAEGLIAERRSKNIFTRAIEAPETFRAAKNLEKYKGTFTPEQLKVIEAKKAEITGEKVSFLTERTAKNLRESPTVSPGFSPKPFYSASPAIAGSVSFTPSKGSSGLASNKSSPYSSIANGRSVSFSPVANNSPSVSSSPSRQKINFSPSPSAKSPSGSTFSSPSPKFNTSPSVSPNLRASPSISPRPSRPSPIPKPRSPLPSPSPSPSPIFSPSPSQSPSPSPTYSPSPYRSPASPSFAPPNNPRSLFGRRSEGENPDKLFNVEVRRRGKFRRLNVRPLGLRSAFKLGIFNVQKTAAASFRVREVGSKEDVKIPNNVPFSFGESKKEKGVYVQKNRFRISTPGEKQEITVKGILSNKTRSIFRR